VEKPEKPELPGARLGPGHGKNMGKKNWASEFSIKPHFFLKLFLDMFGGFRYIYI
jgi:hypothetical protein